ncbi:MAG: hypothetical protein KGI33_01020 [Thaumarchaeota archaeon]|nr:hypothetical protein [Nitrososphaerota archaeon]
MGILFIVVAVIPIIRDLLIFGPGFVSDFFTSHELTTEKISMAVIGFGGFLIILGLREGRYEG